MKVVTRDRAWKTENIVGGHRLPIVMSITIVPVNEIKGIGVEAEIAGGLRRNICAIRNNRRSGVVLSGPF